MTETESTDFQDHLDIHPTTRSEKFIYGAKLDSQKDPLPDPLPMTVWLRGDEDYCGDFSLDADAVMSQLGIKRTRLTQISGRELRVARIKRGRYVVPVYRPEDVSHYLNWSRATATHLKSTQAVTEATASLKDQASDLFVKTESLLSDLSENLAKDMLTRVAAPLSQLLVKDLGPEIKDLLTDKLGRVWPSLDRIEGVMEQTWNHLQVGLEKRQAQIKLSLQSTIQKTIEDQVVGRLKQILAQFGPDSTLAQSLAEAHEDQLRSQAAALLAHEKIYETLLTLQKVATSQCDLAAKISALEVHCKQLANQLKTRGKQPSHQPRAEDGRRIKKTRPAVNRKAPGIKRSPHRRKKPTYF
jgi:hypothetical protein